MEVKNAIIIDGVLHEAVEARDLSIDQQCNNCSICDLCKKTFKDPLCNLDLDEINIFINRGKVTDIKIDKEE